MHSMTPGMDSRTPRSMAPSLPVMPMAVRPAPGMGWALRPRDSIRSQTARTCASEAWDCMTTSMVVVGVVYMKRRGADSVWRRVDREESSWWVLGWVSSIGEGLRCCHDPSTALFALIARTTPVGMTGFWLWRVWVPRRRGREISPLRGSLFLGIVPRPDGLG